MKTRVFQIALLICLLLVLFLILLAGKSNVSADGTAWILNVYVNSSNNLQAVIDGVHQRYRLYVCRPGACFGDPGKDYYQIYAGGTWPKDLWVVTDVNPDTVYCVEIKSDNGAIRHDVVAYRTGSGSKPYYGSIISRMNCPWKDGNLPPNVPNLISPANGSTTTNLNITLHLQDTGDPDNYPRNYRDYYYRLEKTDGTWSQESGWTTSTSWTVTVPSNGNYRWRAQSGDGELGSGWTGWWTFSYNAPPPPSPALTRSRLYVDGRNYLVLEFCGTNIHQDVYIGSKRAGRDFGIHPKRVDFGASEQCATDDNLADGTVLPGRTYYSGVALAQQNVYNVCSSSQGLCDSITIAAPPPSSGFLTFPIGRSPSQIPVNSWFDTYYDQSDRNANIISGYNGIEGYNKISTAYTGPGYCHNTAYFYPGYVRDYKHPDLWYYNCSWVFGRAYNRHGGIDYGVSGANIPIKAAAPGTVVWASGSLIIDHGNGARTFYGHMRQLGRFDSQCRRVGNLYVGSRVGRGEIVGCGTDSANHLHFGVKLNAGRVPWHDGNPANHAPIVDPYTHNLWLGGTPASSALLSGQANLLANDPPTYDNLTPIGLITTNSTYAHVGEAVNFDASNSYDEDGNITRFEWDFGDGITTTGQIVSHSYATPGTHYVGLTVYDNADGVGNAEGQPIVVFDEMPPLTEVEQALRTWSNLNSDQVTVNLAQTPQARFELAWETGDADLSITDTLGRLITASTTISGVVVETGPNLLAFILNSAPAGEYVLQPEAPSGTATGVRLRTSVVDVTPPAEASVQVEVDEGSSRIHLTLAVTDTESLAGMEMRYALNEDSFGAWQPFAPMVQIPWSAEQVLDGVVVQFRDGNGNLSPLFDTTTFHTCLTHDQSPVRLFLPLVIRGQ